MPVVIDASSTRHRSVKTASDTCATRRRSDAGTTPWGTYLTCEENSNGYFASTDVGFAADVLQDRYGIYDAANPASGRDILDSATSYAARFDDDATANDGKRTAQWLPLVFGPGGLDAGNGWTDQADALIRARQAADRPGATMMDCPEWIAANPTQPGEVYVTLTNNSRRDDSPASSNAADGSTRAISANPPLDEANPRKDNPWGQLVRWNEANGDPTATAFTWDIFLFAGNPGVYTAPGSKAGSANIGADNLFNSPDGLRFDREGRLWIETEGN